MEDPHNDLSSINLENIPERSKSSNLSILSNELSSVSDITVSEVVEMKQNPDTCATEIKTLRDKLIENVTILQNELDLFESTTRKECSIKKETLNQSDITEQLVKIQGKVSTMKQKLKESEEIIQKKTKENSELKEILQKLQQKNSGEGNQCICLNACQIF